MVTGIGTISGRGKVWRPSDVRQVAQRAWEVAGRVPRPALHVRPDGFYLASGDMFHPKVEKVMDRDSLSRVGAVSVLEQFHLPLIPLVDRVRSVDDLAEIMETAIVSPANLFFSADPYVAAAARDAAGQEALELEPWKLAIAAEFIAGRIKVPPKIVIALGSGLQDLPADVEDPVHIPFADVPFWPQPGTVIAGHKNKIIAGKLEGQDVVLMAGRFHMYQGVSALGVARLVRTFGVLGGRIFIATNAIGGLKTNMKVGDFLLVKSVTMPPEASPLIGTNIDELGPRFPDMTELYSPALQGYARREAFRLGISLHEGTLNMQIGPQYEPTGVIDALQRTGNAGVGMSHVPEVIAARHMGMRNLGISLVTNMAAGITGRPLSHDEVQVAANIARPKFRAFMHAVVQKIGEESQAA